MKQSTTLIPTVLIAASALATPLAAHAGTFDGWTVNGSAQLLDSGDTLRLTDAVSYTSGSAWAPGKLSLAQDFSVAFSFKLADGSGADGITVTFQNSDAGKTALGPDGGFLGYQNINRSVAFTYDTFDNGWDTDRIGGANTSVAVGGDLINTWSGASVGDVHELRGKVLYSWVDYSAAGNGEFKMYLSDTPIKPATADQTLAAASFSGLFNGNEVYVGFTGATGGFNDRQEVLSVSIAAVPEPSTTALALLGGVGVIGALRRRRMG